MSNGKGKKILQCIRKLLVLLSVAGFLWQVFVVSVVYFGYRTTSSVTFKLLPYVKPQTAILCVRYREVMDRRKFTKETGIKLPLKSYEFPDVYEKMTVEQIFKYTPDPDRVINSCLVPDKHGYISSETQKCAQYFNVSKYFTQEYICYRFVLNQKEKYPIEEVTHSIQNSFLIFEIFLTEEFRDASVVEAIVYTDDGWVPSMSRDYAAKQVVKSRTKGSYSENYMFLSGSDMTTNRLEKPYDTACVTVVGNMGYRCYLPCKLEKYKSIDRVPGSELIFDPVNLKAISESEAQHPEMRAKMRSIAKECREKCYFTWCTESLSITSSVPSGTSKASLGFSVNKPKEPDLYSQSIPIMTFIQYFSFVMGCFGIWFGISFLSFNPHRFRPPSHVASRKLVRFHRKVFATHLSVQRHVNVGPDAFPFCQ